MPLIDEQNEHAIYCSSSYGPVFGGGHDLCIANGADSNDCSTSLDSSYQSPTGLDDDTFLVGSQTFTLSEMEIFGFE